MWHTGNTNHIAVQNVVFNCLIITFVVCTDKTGIFILDKIVKFSEIKSQHVLDLNF